MDTLVTGDAILCVTDVNKGPKIKKVGSDIEDIYNKNRYTSYLGQKQT